MFLEAMEIMILDTAMNLFRKHTTIGVNTDDVDVRVMERDEFKKLVIERIDFDMDEISIVKTIFEILDFIEYGDTSDADDMNQIQEDLKTRGITRAL